MKKNDCIENTLKDNEFAFEIISTNRYGIDDITYAKIKMSFKIFFLLCFLFNIVVTPISILVLKTNIGYYYIGITFLFLLYILIFRRSIFIKSKYTLFYGFISILFISISFLILTISFFSVITFGYFFMLIMLLLCVAITIEAIFGYKYYSKVWNKSKKYNETIVLDLEKGIYDYSKNFKMDESRINKKKKKKVSEETMYNYVIPVSTAAAVLLSFLLGKRSHLIENFDLRFLILPILGIFVGVGFFKISMGAFYNFIKIIHYEKQIGKLIKNGLIIKNK